MTTPTHNSLHLTGAGFLGAMSKRLTKKQRLVYQEILSEPNEDATRLRVRINKFARQHGLSFDKAQDLLRLAVTYTEARVEFSNQTELARNV